MGGMVLMKQLIEKTKINEVLEGLPLPKQKSNRGYNPIQLINNFWVNIWSRASRKYSVGKRWQDINHFKDILRNFNKQITKEHLLNYCFFHNQSYITSKTEMGYISKPSRCRESICNWFINH